MPPRFLNPTVHATVQCTVGLNISAPTTYSANPNSYCTSPPLVYMNTFLTKITRAGTGGCKDGTVTELGKGSGIFHVVITRTVTMDRQILTARPKVLPLPIGWGEGFKGDGSEVFREQSSTSHRMQITCGILVDNRYFTGELAVDRCLNL